MQCNVLRERGRGSVGEWWGRIRRGLPFPAKCGNPDVGMILMMLIMWKMGKMNMMSGFEATIMKTWILWVDFLQQVLAVLF